MATAYGADEELHMADPWLLHTELHLAAVYDCCERTAEKGTAAKGTAAKELLRKALLRRGLL